MCSLDFSFYVRKKRKTIISRPPSQNRGAFYRRRMCRSYSHIHTANVKQLPSTFQLLAVRRWPATPTSPHPPRHDVPYELESTWRATSVAQRLKVLEDSSRAMIHLLDVIEGPSRYSISLTEPALQGNSIDFWTQIPQFVEFPMSWSKVEDH